MKYKASHHAGASHRIAHAHQVTLKGFCNFWILLNEEHQIFFKFIVFNTMLLVHFIQHLCLLNHHHNHHLHLISVLRHLLVLHRIYLLNCQLLLEFKYFKCLLLAQGWLFSRTGCLFKLALLSCHNSFSISLVLCQHFMLHTKFLF